MPIPRRTPQRNLGKTFVGILRLGRNQRPGTSSSIKFNAEDYGRKPVGESVPAVAGNTEKGFQLCYAPVMKIRFSAHGAYHHQYHIVWIPKYRKKILKGELKKFIETRLFDIQGYHPDIEIKIYTFRKIISI